MSFFDDFDCDDEKIIDFSTMKYKVSKKDYFVRNIYDILNNDLVGFCAAGILLENEYNEFLAIKEFRNGKYMWNLIGGKREYNETPVETAFREFKEETSNELKIKKIKKIFWIADSKYFLHNIFVKKNKITLKSNLRWFSIENYVNEMFHPFSNKMIEMYKINS